MISRSRPSSHGQAGFSLVESLIAALILLIVIIGVLPLVSQAMLNNAQGNEASFQTSASIDGTETLLSLPFNSQELVILPGSTSTVVQDVFTLKSNRWIDKVVFDASPAGDTAQYVRTSTIEQFSASDLDGNDNGIGTPGRTLDTPLDGAALPGFVHIKRTRMAIQNQRFLLGLPGSTSGNYEVVGITTY